MQGPLIETEETLIIETPERVPLAFALASIGNRFLAVSIDHAIQFAMVIVAIIVFGVIAGILDSGGPSLVDRISDDLPNWAVAVMIIAVFLIFTGYFAFFEWWWDGQTPGKRVTKLRVIREDGRPITLWEAIARNLLRLFDAIPGFVIPIYSVGLIVVFMNSRDQRVGDLFAGTVVIREREDEAPTFAETFADPIADAAYRRVQQKTAFEGDLNRVTLDQIEVVESFLRRRWDLTERQRKWMAWRIAIPIMYKIKPSYDKETFTYEGFLEELLFRYSVRQRALN